MPETEVRKLAGQAAQANPPKAENGKTIGALKDLTGIFKELPALGAQYGTLIGQIAQLSVELGPKPRSKSLI